MASDAELVRSRRIGALKRVLIGIVWLPIGVLIVVPIALLFGAVHTVLDLAATVTTLDFIRLRSVFWSVWWDLWGWFVGNTGYVLGVADRGTVTAHEGFDVIPSMSATSGKLGGG